MKRFFLYSILSILSFAIITFSTSSIQRPIDGDDSYGFPFRFYVAFSGMCHPCPDKMYDFNIFYLFVDLIIPFIILFLFGSLLRKRKTNRKISQEDLLDDIQ